jgi:SAM-dependent methyltransferase
VHGSNRQWLDHCQRTYGRRWSPGGVLELGALNINGTARDHIRSDVYVGVDECAGDGVDIVCDARQTSFDRNFACIVCTSVLEHTPHWRDVIDHNAKWLRPQGVLLLGWGAEGNVRHDPEPWAAVPVGDVLEFLAAKFDIVEASWERTHFRKQCAPGFYNLVGVLRDAPLAEVRVPVVAGSRRGPRGGAGGY